MSARSSSQRIMKIAMPLMLAWWFQRREGQLRAPTSWLPARCCWCRWVIAKAADLGTARSWCWPPASARDLLRRPVVEVDPAGAGGRRLAIGAIVFSAAPPSAPRACAGRCCANTSSTASAPLLDPTRDPLGKGFHIIQGMIAIGSGGGAARASCRGTQTHLEFIPERTTDFIFAAFAEEFGLAGVGCWPGFTFLIFAPVDRLPRRRRCSRGCWPAPSP